MEQRIGAYFAACTQADKPRLMSYFTPDAIHYFPLGSPLGALRGAEANADCWCGSGDRRGRTLSRRLTRTCAAMNGPDSMRAA